MKKLMITAAAVCMFGAAFAESSCEITDKHYCAYVYRIKLIGKTVKAQKKQATTQCETDICWAKPASFRVAGCVYNVGDSGEDASDCSCECDGHWNLADNSCVFWDNNKKQVFANTTSIEVDVYDVLRNSGERNIVQLGFKIGDLYLAGFGRFNPTTSRLKKASGFFSGTVDKPMCTDECDCEDTTDAMCYAPCSTMPGEEIACEKAVAFGRWHMAWKSEKVALLSNGNDPLTPGVLVPAAFRPQS